MITETLLSSMTGFRFIKLDIIFVQLRTREHGCKSHICSI